MRFKNINKHDGVKRTFKCKMKGGRCPSNTAKGDRCKNRVVIGVGDPCWIHRRKKQHLSVEKSKIKGAGKGLFAYGDKSERVFKKGEVVGQYKGQLLTLDQLHERYGDTGANPYAVEATRAHPDHDGKKIIDSACVRGLMSIANGAAYKSKSNIEFVDKIKADGSLDVRATKGIKGGTELIANYEKEYFQYEGTNKHSSK